MAVLVNILDTNPGDLNYILGQYMEKTDSHNLSSKYHVDSAACEHKYI